MVGYKRALELALTNRTLSAQEALEWGIVTRVLPAGECVDQAAWVHRNEKGDPVALIGLSESQVKIGGKLVEVFGEVRINGKQGGEGSYRIVYRSPSSS